MKFDQIMPFVRYTRCQTMDDRTGYKTRIAYDCRLFYTVDGVGELEVGQSVYKMQKGNMAIINSGIPYCLRSARGKTAAYITVNFDCTQNFSHITQSVQPVMPQKFEVENIFSHMDFEDAPLFHTFCILPDMFRAGALAQQIADEMQLQLVGFQAKMNGLLMEILTECLRADAAYYDASRLKDVLEYIHHAYRQPLSNAVIAQQFGYHPNYLSALFRKVTGKSMHQYLLSIRMKKAIELLETTSLPIGTIAAECGFDDAANFSAAFRKSIGYTPTQCRQNGRFV